MSRPQGDQAPARSRMNISRWALEHGPLTRYLMVVLLVLGVAAYFQLGQDEDPPFTFRAMVVQAWWPGASAQEMAEQVTDKIERLVRIQNYHTQVFAKFIKKLSTTQDGDGSLLDHSIILYGSNMSNSDLHNNDPLPNVVMGKGYGRIKGGQHIKYPQDTPHANLLLTLLQRAGLPYEELGNSSGLLTEI